MAKYCADCYNMDTSANKDGKFKCLQSRKSGYDYVSARKIASSCNCFGEAFQSRRGEREREEYMRISRIHGYYLTTVICEVLGLPSNNEYIDACAYIFDEVMANNKEYDDFHLEYNTIGASLAEELRKEENKDYCGYLYSCYLEPFSVLIADEQIISGIELYQEMFYEAKEKLLKLNTKVLI